MIFQEPTTSLNPCFTVGFQIMAETLRIHEGMDRKRGAPARHRTAGAGRHPGRRRAGCRLSAPALRRHEPARHDRHGDRLQSEAADRRRADHGARRHHPGADPRSAAVAAARARHGADPHHPQHGRGRGDRRARRRDVCRPDHGGAPGGRACSPSPQHPYTAALLAARPESARSADGSPPFPAWCRACTIGRAAACSVRAAPMRRRWPTTCVPICGPGWTALIRCHYPLGDQTRDARIAADRQSAEPSDERAS